MFNFLFDGTIGDILAPVVPSNKLYLAIQHHRNNEIDGLWNITMKSANQLADDTQAPIHVACRYNNRYAVDFALSRGANIEFPDRNGNTPLHYAAKYGNLDMCKYLIEKGAKAHRRNASNQTTYDISENHLVRQYLLPIVLTCEREAAEASGVPIPGTDYGLGIGGGSAAPYATYLSAPPPPPPIGGMYPNPSVANTSFPLPPTSAAVMQPPMTPAASVFQSIPLTPGQEAPVPPPVTVQAPIRNVENRSIIPDGFHSSASDPVLQQKYGHIIEVKNIAPPPTGVSAMGGAPAAPSSYFSSSGPSYGPPSGNIYSRYVAYDATTNSAVTYNQPNTMYPTPGPYGAPSAYPSGQQSVPQMMSSMSTGAPFGNAPVTAPGFSPPAAPNTVASLNTAGRVPAPPGAAANLTALSSSAGVSSSSGPSTPVHPSASRLTANIGDLVAQSSNTLAVEVPVPTFVPPVLQTTPKQKSTDSMHSIDLLTSPDGEIINAGASSSSVL